MGIKKIDKIKDEDGDKEKDKEKTEIDKKEKETFAFSPLPTLEEIVIDTESSLAWCPKYLSTEEGNISN